MLQRFTKWFAVAFAVQVACLPVLFLPYWLFAWLLADLLGLPQEGVASVVLGFGLVIALLSVPVGLLGILLLKLRRDSD